MRQEKFDVKLRCQREWGWLLAIWLFLGGTGAALFLFFQIFGLPRAFGRVGLGLVFLGVAVLLLEQGSPTRAWRALARLRTSWLSRGVLSVTGFVVFSALLVAPQGWLVEIDLLVPAWLATLCASMIVLYPGFFLANNRSIPFWNTLLLPTVLVAYAVLGAAAVVLVASSFFAGPEHDFVATTAALILINVAAILVYLWRMNACGGPARESVRLLHRPPLAWIFWSGVVGVGSLVPLGVLTVAPHAAGAAGACVLVGSLLFRYCVLKAGVYVPYAVLQKGVDFRRINRTGDALEREYGASRAYAGRGG